MLLQFLRPACCDHLVYPNRPGRWLEQLQYCVRRGCWVSWGPFGQSRVHLGENNSDPSFSLKQERHQGWSARGEQSWMMWQLWRLWRGRNRSHHPWLLRRPLAPLWISLSSPVFWSTARIFWNHQPEKKQPVPWIPQSMHSRKMWNPPLMTVTDKVLWGGFCCLVQFLSFFVETDSLGLGQSSIEFLAIVRMLWNQYYGQLHSNKQRTSMI